MSHALSPRSASRSGSLALGLIIASVAALGCPADGEGDDLPPGAFTTGGDDVVPPPGSESDSDPGATSTVPDDTTTTTSTPEDTGSSSGGLPAMISHAEHILPIWTVSCATSACHDADAPQVGLDLASEGVYERICTQTHAFSGFSYIDCEGLDTTRSYMFRKIENSHLDGDISGASGGGMPPAPLPAETVALIEAWIVGGALP